MKFFIVNNGSYPFDILVCIGAKHQEILDWLKRNKAMTLDEEEKEELLMQGITQSAVSKNKKCQWRRLSPLLHES